MSIPTASRSIALAGILTVLLAGCGQSEIDPRALPPLVRVAEAGTAEGADREFAGIVGARVQSDLAFRVGGKVMARLVDTGQAVRRGQPLMRIDATDYALASQAAAGTVAAARARAAQTSAEAQARVSRNDAGYTLLVADADGTVVGTLAEPGQVVGAGQTVVRLARSGPREAIVALPETLRPRLGTVAQARTYSGLGGTARLRQLSDAADPATRTFEARFVLDGAPASAPLGSTVTIELDVPSRSPTISVPLGAIHDRGRGPGVWVIGGGRTPNVSWRPVRLAALGEETAAVSAGLRRGERFVALGAHMLRQGQAVRIAGAGR